MPIYKKPNQKPLTTSSANRFDDHSMSEAAKMKRAREQAYFNSYDFDAIEVVPFDENNMTGDDLKKAKNVATGASVDSRNANGGSHYHHQQQQHKTYQQYSQHSSQLHQHFHQTNPPHPQQQQKMSFSANTKHPPNQNTLRHLAALSPKSQKRLQTALISSKSLSDSTMPSTSASSSCSEEQSSHHPHHQHQHHPHNQHHSSINIMNRFTTSMPSANELKYLQHFGSSSAIQSPAGAPLPLALPPLTSSSSLISSTAHKRQRNDDITPLELVLDVRNAIDMVDENFLLPRAMIKYHGAGNTNSMPLTEIQAAAAGNGKFLHSSQQNKKPTTTTNIIMNKSNKNNSQNNKNNNIKMMMMMTNKQGNSGFPNSKQVSSLCDVTTLAKAASPNEMKSSKENPATLALAIGNTKSKSKTLTAAPAPAPALSNLLQKPKKDSSTEMVAGAVAAVSVAASNVRQKKPSTSSTITLTSASASVVSHTEALAADDEDDGLEDEVGVHDDDDDDDDDDGIHIVEMVDEEEEEDEPEDVLKSKNILRPILSRSTITSSSLSSSGDHGNVRSHSHQSHYSTDKSGAGSSGYYSSNVCSTYSLDEHIYCEPVVDIVKGKTKTSSNVDHLATSSASVVASGVSAASLAAAKAKLQNEIALAKHFQLPQNKKALANVLDATSRTLEMQRISQNKRKRASAKKTNLEKKESKANNDDDDDDDDDDNEKDGKKLSKEQSSKDQSMEALPPYNESLRVLEASIENLDRHLKTYQSFNAPEQIVGFIQSQINMPLANELAHEKQRLQKLLPTIVEGFDGSAKKGNLWPNSLTDDSLMDIDFDSFLLVDEKATRKPSQGIDNPGFLADEQEANHYKCAKYINSCPENAYHVENDMLSTSTGGYVKRYEDQLHFQNTRELLEDVRDKIRLLSRSRNSLERSENSSQNEETKNKGFISEEEIPKELEGMIKTLKEELESYLARMNQHSELEIRQLCSGLTKNHHIVKMKKAFERRKSFQEGDFATYEAIRDGLYMSSKGLGPLSVRHEVTSIRCASDPNFKMKRKSLTEVFPLSDLEANMNEILPFPSNEPKLLGLTSQLQRNLSFHKPVLSHLDSQQNQGLETHQIKIEESTAKKDNTEEKDPLASWHRKKPSIWEMYYGTNRLNQTLLGGKRNNNNVIVNTNPATLSYPSSRPESDFTLDLPRAEQLRVKMEKEKKFRQRCRLITTFLSLIFFLLTVMVVSLVLTRGKRMFGSMI